MILRLGSTNVALLKGCFFLAFSPIPVVVGTPDPDPEVEAELVIGPAPPPAPRLEPPKPLPPLLEEPISGREFDLPVIADPCPGPWVWP